MDQEKLDFLCFIMYLYAKGVDYFTYKEDTPRREFEFYVEKWRKSYSKADIDKIVQSYFGEIKEGEIESLLTSDDPVARKLGAFLQENNSLSKEKAVVVPPSPSAPQ